MAWRRARRRSAPSTPPPSCGRVGPKSATMRRCPARPTPRSSRPPPRAASGSSPRGPGKSSLNQGSRRPSTGARSTAGERTARHRCVSGHTLTTGKRCPHLTSASTQHPGTAGFGPNLLGGCAPQELARLSLGFKLSLRWLPEPINRDAPRLDGCLRWSVDDSFRLGAAVLVFNWGDIGGAARGGSARIGARFHLDGGAGRGRERGCGCDQRDDGGGQGFVKVFSLVRGLGVGVFGLGSVRCVGFRRRIWLLLVSGTG